MELREADHKLMIRMDPTAGGRPSHVDADPRRKPLTSFDKDLIFRYAFSQDGKQIAIERGNAEVGAFLLRDTSK